MMFRAILVSVFMICLNVTGCGGGTTTLIAFTALNAVGPDSPQEFTAHIGFRSSDGDMAGKSVTVTAVPDGDDIIVDPSRKDVKLDEKGKAMVTFHVSAKQDRTKGQRSIEVTAIAAWNKSTSLKNEFEVQ